MSWKAYEVLSIIPTFEPAPVLGIGDVARGDVRIGQDESFYSWDGTTGLAYRFRYQPQSPAEWANLREFVRRQRGIGASFFLPTWQPDFDLAADASAGDTEIVVVDAGFSDLTEDRPDTEKRIIFTLTAGLTFQANRVVQAVDDGPNEILTLEDPLGVDLVAATDLVGLCYLSTFADNIHTFTADRPGRGKIDPRFLTVRNTRRVNDQQLVTSIDTGNAVAFSDLLATDEDPYPFDLRFFQALGPNNYQSPQATPFFEFWRFSIDGTSVTFQRSDGMSPIETSALYDSAFETEHLRGCFDALGSEVLAWKINSRQFRIGHFVGGLPTRIDVDGFAPVAFFTWPIDSGAATAGDAEVVVYYLKPGYSSIFARLKGDNFAVEYQAIRTPSAPLYLHDAVKNGAFLEIRGIDVGHRRAVWRAEYVPPLIPEFIGTTIDFTQGEFRSLIRIVNLDGESGSASIGFDFVGEYRSLVIDVDAGSDSSGAVTGLDVVGEYFSILIPGGSFSESSSVELAFLTGENRLVAKTGQGSDDAAVNLGFTTGDYSIP